MEYEGAMKQKDSDKKIEKKGAVEGVEKTKKKERKRQDVKNEKRDKVKKEKSQKKINVQKPRKTAVKIGKIKEEIASMNHVQDQPYKDLLVLHAHALPHGDTPQPNQMEQFGGIEGINASISVEEFHGTIGVSRGKSPYTGIPCFVITQSFPNSANQIVYVNDKSLPEFIKLILGFLV